MQSYKVESFFAMIQNGVERSFHLKRKKPGDLMTSRNILKAGKQKYFIREHTS